LSRSATGRLRRRVVGHLRNDESLPGYSLFYIPGSGSHIRCDQRSWHAEHAPADADRYGRPSCAATAMPRDVSEVIAESVASAVCSRFGLDLSLRSVDYVAGWLDDPEAFRVDMAAIHDGAASLIDAIEAAVTDTGELELAA
jgi:hypothetical protein